MGASKLPSWLDAPAQGMNHDDISGRASKAPVTRLTTIATATSTVGRRGKTPSRHQGRWPRSARHERDPNSKSRQTGLQQEPCTTQAAETPHGAHGKRSVQGVDLARRSPVPAPWHRLCGPRPAWLVSMWPHSSRQNFHPNCILANKHSRRPVAPGLL